MKKCIGLIVILLLTSAASAADNIPSLAKVFEGKFRFGFGGTHDYFVRTELNKPESPIRRIVETQSNIIGINCFYPNSIHPKADIWRWENCDQLLIFADQHPDWPRRAHILFWPFNDKNHMDWLIRGEDGQPVSRDEAIKRLRDYIHTVMSRYKGRFQYWDVVNEVIDPQQPDGIRKGLWKEVIGPEIIEIAFQAAREADPNTKLFYNDFNEWVPAKRELIFKLVKKLKDKGLIDGIGLQAHYNMKSPTARELDETISRFAELGLEIQITELDIDNNPGGKLAEFTPELAETQARRYREIFDVYLKHASNITTVMTWNVTDQSSWLRSHPIKRITWPLLFDETGQPKPAFWILANPPAK